MNAHEFINNKLQDDPNNLYVLIEEKMLDEEMMQLILNPSKKLTKCKLVM
jgi:hypothetical protein